MTTGLTIKQAAVAFGVSVRNVERAGFIRTHGIPEIGNAVAAGKLKLLPAERIARLPQDRQLAELTAVLNGDRKPQKRTPPGFDRDIERIGNLINSVAGRWTTEERRLARIVLTDWGRQLVEGPDPDDDDEQEEPDDE